MWYQLADKANFCTISVIELLDDSNTPIKSEATPDYMNQYFTNIGPKLAAKLNLSLQQDYNILNNLAEEPFKLLPVTNLSIKRN